AENRRAERQRARQAETDAADRHDDLSGAPQGLDALQAEQIGSAPGRSRESRRSPVAKADSAGGRPWRDAAGKVIARGDFVSLLDGNVCLQQADGAGTVVPFARLCEDDKKFVRGIAGDDLAEVEPVVSDPSGSVIGPTTSAVAAAAPAARDRNGIRKPTESAGASASPLVDNKKVVIPFDFVSQFDDGRYGRMVGDMLWRKLERGGRVVVPETMLDVRDFCESRRIRPTPDTPLDEMSRIVQDDFRGHVGVWGQVERVPGHEWEVYDLTIRCVDFAAGPEPRVVYETTARTNSVSEIPHLYVEQMLDALYGRKPGEPPPPNPIEEKNWLENPNLVVGDFQQGTGAVPKGWDRGGGQHREPLGGLVSWGPEVGNPANKVIRFTFGQDIGDSYGVMYYSDWFPVEEGAKYRSQLRYRTNGPKVIVFIKCYSEVAGPYQATAADGRRSGGPPAQGVEPPAYVPEMGQRREVYRSQQNMKGDKNVWNTHTEDFTPKHTRYSPHWGRVMLYAYLGAGVVEFDDVVVKQILPPSPGDHQKLLRHSLETGVTMKEMEENQRRSWQMKQEQLKQEQPKEK
ncbi:MAG: SHD1 domain-containing protein, partial [Patescibacteria group bacterium]|nr:SHD1 domain-containing protein [Patescibacteria group bacterium]